MLTMTAFHAGRAPYAGQFGMDLTSTRRSAVRRLRKLSSFDIPRDNFMVKENGKFVGIDNSDGDAFTEEFKSKERCIRWLAGEEFYDDEDEADSAVSDVRAV